MRAMRGLAAAAAAGVVLGLALVLVGVPYGRANLTAFAELYHGEVDTTGTFHLALDCDTATPGTQSACSVNAFMVGAVIDVDVTLGNSTGAASSMAAFNAVVESLNPLLNARALATCVSPYTECNPDFLSDGEAAQGIPAAGWLCAPPPNDDYDPGAPGEQSLISCGHNAFGESIQPGSVHRQLARVTYDVAGVAQDQSASLTLRDVNVFDEAGNELMSCNPVSTVAGHCFGATITAIGHQFPTPTWTHTPVPDVDGDGVPDASDNCPSVANSAQENSNANLISNAPYYAVNDLTRNSSDGDGDACDDDDDGDSLLDLSETPGPPCATSSGGTNMLDVDSDGDRAVDGAECALGFDPTDASNKPTAAQCGAAADPDGDRLLDRIEVCGYGSSAVDADSDDDGVRDGCEAVSLNTDQVVNSIDQLLLAQEIIRRMGGGAPHVNFDVNKDGNANSADQLLMAQLMIPSGQCP